MHAGARVAVIGKDVGAEAGARAVGSSVRCLDVKSDDEAHAVGRDLALYHVRLVVEVDERLLHTRDMTHR